MKGIVFTEFLEMVEERYSAGVVDQLLLEAKLPSGGSKFAYNDAAQRSAWGLPATGRVSRARPAMA